MKKQSIKVSLILFITMTGLFAQSTIKWQQPFDGLDIPDGWQVIDADESDTGLILVQSAHTPGGTEILPQTGQSFWTSNVQNANLTGVIDEWLISPRISVIYAGDSLYFWAGAVDELFDDSLRIKISTTNSNPASFIHELGYIKVDGPVGTWHQYGFDLSEFDSSDIYFAINYYIKDGGAGGEHSDFIWIDHPVISGDPGTFNNPPSMIFLQEPVNQSIIDINLSSVDFHWSASQDLDGEDLTYTLSIVNVFPQLHFTDIPDTSFSLNWKNLLNENTTYRWTIEVTDGQSRVASLDTFAFELADPSAIASDMDKIPADFVLYQNYPNPFNPTTIINYEIPITNYVVLDIYNIVGQNIATLVSGEQTAGSYKVTWDAREFSAGLYFYQLRMGNQVISRKMVLMK